MSFANREDAAAFEQQVRVLEACVAPLADVPNVALRMIADGALKLCVRSGLVGEASGSRILDSICLSIGSGLSRPAASRYRGADRPKQRVVYLVTELYADGGHTRILEDLIQALPQAEHVVVWLSCEAALREDNYASILRVEALPPIYRVRGSLECSIAEGLRILDVLEPDVLMQLGHPNDPVSVALMLPRPGCRRIVVHHSDHSFSLGRFIPGATHVSLTKRFTTLASERWGIEAEYLPMTCRDPYAELLPKTPGALTTASSGSAHKFDLDGEPSYLDVLRERFTRREGMHVHYGAVMPEQMERINALLDEIGARPRFVRTPYVKSLAAAMMQAGVTVYIDSVPGAGAKTLIEAMAAGIAPCFTAHDASFDGSTYSYEGAFSWRTARELGKFLAEIDNRELRIQGERARAHYEREHAPTVFSNTLRAVLRNAKID